VTRTALLAAVLLAPVATVAAQGITGGGLGGNSAVNATALRTDLARLQRELQSLEAKQRDTIALLSHHNVGFRVDIDLGTDLILDATSMDQRREQLETLEAPRVQRRQEYADLLRRAELEGLLPTGLGNASDAAQTRQDDGPVNPWLDGAASGLPSGAGAGASREPAVSRAQVQEMLDRLPGADDGEPESKEPLPTDPQTNVYVVAGSRDHSEVARLHYRAAHDLSVLARQYLRDGREDEARALRSGARTRYEQALAELDRIIDDPNTADLRDLFHQGKCQLGLFDLDIAEGKVGLTVDVKVYEQRFEAIRSTLMILKTRDEKVVDDETVPGPWAQTAEGLISLLRWRQVQDSKQPLVPDTSWKRKETDG